VPLFGKLVRLLFNSDIYCRFRSAILMPHPYGIVIHSKAQIGSGVTIMQQVTIGSKDPGVNLAPVIEDSVYIGAGAKILGAIRVGRGAVIGANAVVTRDVPSYCTVVGANRILRNYDRNGNGADADPYPADGVTARASLSSPQES
jgi:serine O-acetyltransferase